MRRIMFVLFLNVFCTTLPSATRQQELTTELDQLVQASLAFAEEERAPIAGLSLAVYHRGQPLLVKAYGHADLERRSPVTDKTRFRIGSITKQFTAAGIMLLVEEGRLQLTDPITKFLPDYPEPGRAITIHHLLTHMSGIANYTELEDWTKFENVHLSRQELIKKVSAKPLLFKPGTSWSYSNSGYYLLGMIIEKVSGVSYAEFVEKRLLAKAGLKNTFYCPNEQNYPEAARGYRIDAGRLVPANPMVMDHPYAAGALCSNAQDLAAWNALMAKGTVVRPESYLKMIAPASVAPKYGYGFFIGEVSGHRWVGHGGDINGFNSELVYYPDDDITIALVVNSERYFTTRLGVTLGRSILGLIQDKPITDDEALPLIGNWQFPEADAIYQISWEGKRLLARRPDKDGKAGPPMRLLSQGEGRFLINEKGVELRFDVKGKPSDSVLLFVDGLEIKGSRLPL